MIDLRTDYRGNLGNFSLSCKFILHYASSSHVPHRPEASLLVDLKMLTSHNYYACQALANFIQWIVWHHDLIEAVKSSRILVH